jgi:hypothetical protein
LTISIAAVLRHQRLEHLQQIIGARRDDSVFHSAVSFFMD